MRQQNKRSLSPAQLKYFKISPKLIDLDPTTTKKLIDDAFLEKTISNFTSRTNFSADIQKISKPIFGHFEKTVNNFAVLMNKNLGNETTYHQIQKFGERVRRLNSFMKASDKNIGITPQKMKLQKKIKSRSDGRTSLKAVYQYKNIKLFVTLKSFEIQIIRPNKARQGLPIPYLHFLTQHIIGNKIINTLQSALKFEGNQIIIQYEKIESSKTLIQRNPQIKYFDSQYNFSKFGQQLVLKTPTLQIAAPEIGLQQNLTIQNTDILKIIQSNFSNIETIVKKYLDKQQFEKNLSQKSNKKIN